MSRYILACLFAVCLHAADYDILIRNARVIDGIRKPLVPRRCRRSGTAGSQRWGGLEGRSAYRDIDAAGRVVAPGFIDVHTHVEGDVEKIPSGDNYLLDGVTTVITGNCGGSEVNLGEWFSKLDKLGLGLNVGSLIGHNSVREAVMGTANRQATPEEIREDAGTGRAGHARRRGRFLDGPDLHSGHLFQHRQKSWHSPRLPPSMAACTPATCATKARR